MTQNVAALIRYRIEQAEEALAAARLLLRETLRVCERIAWWRRTLL